MKTTIDVLSALSRKLDGASDYAIAKALGVTRGAVSKYRTGTSTFDDATAMKAADILGVEPAAIMLLAHAERTKTPEVRRVWVSLADRFALNFEDLLSLMGQRRSPTLA